MNEIKKILRISFFLLMIIFLITTAYSGMSISTLESKTSVLTNESYNYFTYPEMTSLLHDLADEYPDIVHLESIGTTYHGRSIWMVKLSKNASVEEDQPGILLMGAHHGNEKPSFEAVIFFIQFVVEMYYENQSKNPNSIINRDLIEQLYDDNSGIMKEDLSAERVREVLNKTQIYCIPMVNPDGVAANTRKNRAPNYGPDGKSDVITSYGVDLNRNYGFRWFLPYLFKENYFFEWLTDDRSGIYRGTHPFSELESTALKNFVETKNIAISLSYHDWGEWMIFPWMHSSAWVPHERMFRSVGENMSRINEYELRIYGQYGEREYVIPRFQGTVGTSENWLYARRNILAYTIELCPYRSPSNPAIVYDACYRHLGVNLYVAERSWTIEEEKLTTYKPTMSQPFFFNLFF
ncbi:MAG: M14 family zinc carboxypeptidase [Thermoplasmatota archaeon]